MANENGQKKHGLNNREVPEKIKADKNGKKNQRREKVFAPKRRKGRSIKKKTGN